MKVKAKVFVISKSISKSADNQTTYYNASIQFDGEDNSRRVSVKKELYDDIETHVEYEDAGFDIRSGISKAGSPYTMIVMESIGA